MKTYKFVKPGLIAAVLMSSTYALENIEPVSAKADSASFDYLSERVKSLMSKSGVAFGGEFKSRALGSVMGGNLVDKAPAESDSIIGKKSEHVLSTTLDLEMRVGPHSALQGRADIRLHQDWRNMFAASMTPLSTRWLSVDGNVKDVFFYNVGDFTQKYSRYTLWTPEPEIMYEPYIFARQRKEVMNEVYAGNNNRVLQGIDLNFMAKVAPAFNELRVQAYGTRLRTAGEYFDFTYRPFSLDIENVSMDRYSAGANVFAGIRDDIEVGGTFIITGDALGTYKKGTEAEGKLLQDRSIVLGFNGAFGTGAFEAIDKDFLNVRLDVEGAYSIYEDTLTEKMVGDSIVKTTDSTLFKETKNGVAVSANLGTKLTLGDIGSLKLDLGALYNDDKFINEMAQSPVYVAKQVLNTSVQNGAFSSFDGMYKSVFKYTPGQDEFYTKLPMNKISWTRGVFTKEELDTLVARGGVPQTNSEVKLDRTYSPIMYFGQATPNRFGAQTALSGTFLDNAISAKALFNLYQTPKGDTVVVGSDTLAIKYEFLQMGGGISVDVSKFGNWWAYPFVLSGSAKYSESKEKQYGVETDYNDKSTVLFANGGAYWKFWKRAAVMGGYQFIEQATKNINTNGNSQNAKRQEMQWAGGLEYSVTEGGTLTGTVGQVVTQYPTGGNIVDGEVNEDASLANFKAWQFDLFLTVNF